METSTFSEDLRQYIAILWRWAWLVIIMVVLGGATAFIISKRTVPVYMATTRLLINEAPATKNTDYASVLASERLARTYSELLKTQPVLEEVISRLGLTRSERQLSTQIEVNLLRDTQLIDVSVEDIDPVLAADIANTVVAVFSEQNQMLQASRFATSKESLSTQLSQMNEQIETTTTAIQALGETPEDKAERDRLETVLAEYSKTYSSLLQSYESVRLAEASSISNVVQVETAFPSDIPIRPRTVRNTALGMVVGLLLGVGVVFLIDVLDDTLSPEDVNRQLGLPVLGVISRHQIENGAPVVKNQPRSPVAEAFRSLRTNIQFASVDKPLRTLLVTSPSPQDGKSTVAVNLGVSLAQSGYKVAVVETDLRRPQVHKRLGLSNRDGISGMFVQSKMVLNGALRETSIDNLFALTSGALPPNPSELLGSEKMYEILNLVGERTDIILLDSPPVMAVTDAAVLAPRVDGVLLVVKPGSTKLAACRQAIEQLQRVGANILGVVLNDVELNRSRYHYYRGYYYTYYDNYYNDESETSRVEKDFVIKQ
jgi:non-specific protein-tyrosine kinase